MELTEFLREVTATPGLTGNEGPVAQYIKQKWEPLCDEVYITPLNSVIGHIKGVGPKVMFAAHLEAKNDAGSFTSYIEDKAMQLAT